MYFGYIFKLLLKIVMFKFIYNDDNILKIKNYKSL